MYQYSTQNPSLNVYKTGVAKPISYLAHFTLKLYVKKIKIKIAIVFFFSASLLHQARGGVMI